MTRNEIENRLLRIRLGLFEMENFSSPEERKRLCINYDYLYLVDEEMRLEEILNNLTEKITNV